jgi:hypothetical protein
MKPYINKAALNKTAFSSKEISILSYLVHPIQKEGNYQGTIYRGKEVIDRFKLVCHKRGEEKQVNIDLSGFNLRNPASYGEKTFTLGEDGSVVFFDSKNDHSMGVKLELLRKGKEKAEGFDTAELGKGDLYATTFLRPGLYKARFSNSRQLLEVDVIYPEKPDLTQRRKAQEPVSVDVTEKGFSRKRARLYPGQGLVFQMKANGTVDVQLEKATEPKKQKPQPPFVQDLKKKKKRVERKIRWENPKYK